MWTLSGHRTRSLGVVSTCNLFKAACLASGAANCWSASRQSKQTDPNAVEPAGLALKSTAAGDGSHITPHTHTHTHIPPHITLSYELTRQRVKQTLAVSSTALYQQETKLRGLTLFCCPCFSYNIATTQCCRRLCCCCLSGFIPPSSFLPQPNRYSSCFI